MTRLVIMAAGAAVLYILQAQQIAPTPAGARMGTGKDEDCGCSGAGDDLFGPPAYA